MSANLSGLIVNGDFHLSFEQQLIALQLYSKCLNESGTDSSVFICVTTMVRRTSTTDERFTATDFTDYTDSVTCLLRQRLVTGLEG